MNVLRFYVSSVVMLVWCSFDKFRARIDAVGTAHQEAFCALARSATDKSALPHASRASYTRR